MYSYYMPISPLACIFLFAADTLLMCREVRYCIIRPTYNHGSTCMIADNVWIMSYVYAKSCDRYCQHRTSA